MGDVWLKHVFATKGYDWDTVPYDELAYWGYGALDPVITCRLFEKLYPTTQREAYERELAYADMMYRIEERGIRVDRSLAEHEDARLYNEEEELLTVLRNEYGIRSPFANQQVEEALRSLGWEPDEYTETGQARLDKEIMQSLLADERYDKRLLRLLIEAKHIHKLRVAYLAPMAEGSTLHPEIRTMGARTGRSSISNPPMQQLPSDDSIVRNCVLPLEEGHKLYSVDYDGQELRIIAALSGEKHMLREFNEGSGDLHTLVAEMVRIPRRVAKTLNFALAYGAGTDKLARTCGVSFGEMEDILREYDNKFPAVRRWLDRTGRMPSVTTTGGRILKAVEDKGYALANHQIQGSGADVLKEACLRLEDMGYGDYIVLPIHDEVLVSLPPGHHGNEVAAIMQDDESVDGITLTAASSEGVDRWGELYS